MPGSRMKSLFNQELDRAIFATYFLGAVVPVLALGYSVRQYALPAVDGDRLATSIVLGAAVGIGLLSLASFFALRRLTRTAVARMDAHAARMSAMLDVSRELSEAPHVHAAAEVTAGCALRMCDAEVVIVMTPGEGEGKPPEVCEAVGISRSAVYREHEEEIHELAVECLVQGRGGSMQPVGAGTALTLPIATDGRNIGVLILIESRGRHAELFTAELVDSLSVLTGLAGAAIRGADLRDSQRNFFTHATEIMVAAVDAHVAQRSYGAHRVASVANRIGRELGLGEQAMRRLHFATLLSDIGMLKISTAQQRNPQHLARHAAFGHRMLSRIKSWRSIADIVLHHHDRYDAVNPPSGKPSPELPLESRIINVAERAVVLLSDESAKLEPYKVGEKLAEDSGGEFDPAVVDAMLALCARGELDAIQE